MRECEEAPKAHALGTALFLGALVSACWLATAQPARASDPIQVETISAGGRHSCALEASGQAICWGRNQVGQLGNGIITGEHIANPNPIPVSGLADATQISAGYDHTCAVRESGQAVCWGRGGGGKLGNGTITTQLTPTPVEGLSDAIAISAGTEHTCAIRVSGQAVCWGNNELGQLGNGTSSFMPSASPVAVAGLTDAVQLDTGFYADNTCAVKASGQAVCWGANYSGQLGNGSQAKSLTPIAVSDLTGAAKISSGLNFACAVNNSGGAFCWGSNECGRLGDGTTTNRFVPTPVVNGPGTAVQAASCGGSPPDGGGDGGPSSGATEPPPSAVMASPPLDPKKARIAIAKVAPKGAVLRPGRTVTLRATVRNTGDAQARAVKVCPSVPRKAKAAVRGLSCKSLGQIAPGAAKVAALTVRTTTRASGAIKVTLKASSANADDRSASATLRVRGG